MPQETPYSSVVAALAKQSAAINQLAKELKTEFEQYRTATKNKDTARADAIAAAIDKRTAKLVEATEALESTHPDAGVGGGPAAPGSGGGDIDNELPGFTPKPPDSGIEDRPPARPGNDLPNAPARPDAGLPEKPVDPGFGGGRPQPGDPDFGKPEGGRPGNDLPTPPARPGGGPVPPEGGTKPIDPDEPPEVSHPDTDGEAQPK